MSGMYGDNDSRDRLRSYALRARQDGRNRVMVDREGLLTLLALADLGALAYEVDVYAADALERYGEEAQRRMVVEEVADLLVAMARQDRGRGRVEDVASECSTAEGRADLGAV